MFAKTSKWTGVAISVAGAFAATPAQAGMAVDAQGGAAYVRGTWANFGYSLNVNEPIQVDALGLWDRFGDGLAESHEVGIWDSDGTLLASAFVDSNSAAVPSANAAHSWRFTSIAPLDLQPGAYKLGAFYTTTADAFLGNADASPVNLLTAPEVSFGQSFVTTGGTEFFTEPVSTTGFNPGFFGPNLSFSAVPEPASLICLALSGALLAGRRR